MQDLSTEDLQALAARTFGRTVSAEQAEAYRPRLPTFAWAVERLQAFEEALGQVAPASVFQPKQFDGAGRAGK